MLGFEGLNRVFLQGIPSPRPSSLRIFKVTKRWVGWSLGRESPESTPPHPGCNRSWLKKWRFSEPEPPNLTMYLYIGAFWRRKFFASLMVVPTRKSRIYPLRVFPKKPYHTEIPHEGGKVDRTSLFTSTTVLWAFRLPTAFLDVFGPQNDGPWKAGNGTL